MAIARSVIAQSTQLLLNACVEKKTVNVEELIRMNADTIPLPGHVIGDLSQIRRDYIHPYLSEDFYSLCSIHVPVTDYLFGNEDDLQTRTANINASNKSSCVTSEKKSNYQNQSGNKISIYSNRGESDWKIIFFSEQNRTETLARNSAYSEKIKSMWEYAESAMDTSSKLVENLHVSNYSVYLPHVLNYLHERKKNFQAGYISDASLLWRKVT